MRQQLDLLRLIVKQGVPEQQPGDCASLTSFGHQLRFDLETGFPISTTKRIHFPDVVHELLWFLTGQTNVQYLQDRGVLPYSPEDGATNAYMSQWRAWQTKTGETIDQLSKIIKDIRHNPNSRRHIVAAWNPTQLESEAAAPDHTLFQAYVSDTKLSSHFYLRSIDVFTRLGTMTTGCALLTHVIAQQCNLSAHELIITIGAAYILDKHRDQITLQLHRRPQPLPQLQILRKRKTIFNYKPDDFELTEYKSHPDIPLPHTSQK
jgi:thymidylate synthase